MKLHHFWILLFSIFFGGKWTKWIARNSHKRENVYSLEYNVTNYSQTELVFFWACSKWILLGIYLCFFLLACVFRVNVSIVLKTKQWDERDSECVERNAMQNMIIMVNQVHMLSPTHRNQGKRKFRLETNVWMKWFFLSYFFGQILRFCFSVIVIYLRITIRHIWMALKCVIDDSLRRECFFLCNAENDSLLSKSNAFRCWKS